ncbi:MAG: lysine--tRNA ligase [Patescibacteria group bacterium]|nr:lysine--tRNA ligase [Patescibacteria group bacterium]
MLQDEIQVRREKLDKLKALGIEPYPVASQRDTEIAEALSEFDAWSASSKTLVLAGRLMTTRLHGSLLFADMTDGTGKIQLVVKQDTVGEESFKQFSDLIDPGDIVEANGTLFQTKRGERSLEVQGWRILSKALLPLPEKWHGLQDVEKRYREREMDLLSNPEVKARFLTRSRLISSLRHYLDERDFVEVETPILQSIPGGANARPFITHHNALDIDLYLRIAPELYLKRLVVGGFERVYEIGRCFRNEGIDYAHNPEFTMIELYWSYASKEKFIGFLEEMLVSIIQASVGRTAIAQESGETVDFATPYPRVTFREAILESCGIDIDLLKTEKEVVAAAVAKGLKLDFSECHGLGEHFDELYKKTARPKISQPTWVFDYPAELKPLAGVHPMDPTKSSSCQLVVMGAEVVNAYYHELSDPLVQRKHLEEQQGLREQGSEVAQCIDEGFLRALEHGLPPTSGMGFGIDRLVAFLTGAPNLKEVILFPTLRPQHEGKDEVSQE